MNHLRTRYPIYIQLVAVAIGLAGLSSCTGLSSKNSVTPPQPLAITTPDANGCGTPPCELNTGTENLGYSFAFGASGGVPPYSWTVTGGTGLPKGLSLTSSGCGSDVNCDLQGTPSGESYPVTHTFTVLLTDSASNQASLSVSLTIDSTATGSGIPPTFFGMHVNQDVAPWPIVAVGAVRLHDGGVNWSEIETSQGNYDFSRLDKLMSQAEAKGVDLLYTFVDVPSFHSSAPSDTTCAYPQNGNGGCDPPAGLNADGTGSDAPFKNFVTALATHVGSKITYWEMWNEPDVVKMWKGTPQQLVRMAQDATCIIKGTGPGCTASAINARAQMLTPPPTSGPNVAAQWMDSYLAAGGGQYADVISFHGYVQCPTACPTVPTPEVILAIVSNLRSVMASHGQQGKPLFDSEGSWGSAALLSFNDPDQRAAFIARDIVLQQSAGVARFYWYRWNVSGTGYWGTLWDTVKTDPEGCNNVGTPYLGGYVCKPGTAYGQVYDWLVGATLSSLCAANGTVWVCGYSRTNYQAQIVWDTSQTCSGGVCTTSSYSAGAQYKQYRDLSGKTTAITSGTVPVGAKPVIIETGAP